MCKLRYLGVFDIGVNLGDVYWTHRFMIPSTHYVKEAFFSGDEPLHYQSIISFAFTPIALTGWLEAHGTTVSIILAWPVLANGLSTSFKKLEVFITTHSKALSRFVNIFVGTGVLATTALSFSFFGVASTHFRDTSNTFSKLQHFMAPLQSSWEPGQNLTLVPEGLQLLEEFQDDAMLSASWLGHGFGVYTASFLLVVLLYM